MMPDSLGHGLVLPVGYAKFLEQFRLNDACQWSVMGVADVRAEVMDDVMIETADKPAHQRVFSSVVSGCGEDVVNAVFKLAAMQGEIAFLQ